MKKVLLFLVLCTSFSVMMAQDAEVIKGILPSGLTSSVADNNATFKFYSNSAAESAYLTFYDATTGEEVGTYNLTGVVEGDNEFVVPCSDLPGTNGQDMNWAVTLVGKPITEYKLINNLNDFNYTYSFNTVDNNPESDFFGRIYVGHRPTSGAADRGLWIYNPDYTRVNSSVINTRSDGLSFSSNYRMGIDAEGKVYMPDWGDATSGVFVFDPANPDAGFKEFFSNPDGTSLARTSGTSDPNINGLLTNADGEAVASSIPGVAITGSGENKKLYAYNEDILIDGTGNNVMVYNIGTATSWNKAPDAIYAVGPKELNTNGNIVPDVEHGGVWIGQYRSKGNNTEAIPSLLYVNAAGEVVYNSGTQADVLNGSNGAGFTLTPDGKQLVISDGDTNISFFDITWTNGVPSLSYNTQFTPAVTEIARLASGIRQIYQMNFDYAGNLILSGAKVGIYSIPTEENVTTVPAKKALLVQHVDAAVEHSYTVAGNLEDVFGAQWSTTNTACDMQMNDNNVYEWTSSEFEIAANTEIQFKVAVDHNWDVSYGPNGGSENATVTPDKDGVYKLTVYYEPEDGNNVYGVLTLIQEAFGKVYILGNVNNNVWATNVGVEMETEDGKIYTKHVDVTVPPTSSGAPVLKVDETEGQQYGWFSFSTKLMDADDDWAGLAPYRFGAVSDGDFRVYKNQFGQDLSLTADNGKSFQLEVGSYDLVVDKENMTLVITGETLTGIENLNMENVKSVRYYNLQGVESTTPFKGVNIVVREMNDGSKVTTKMIK